jgi:hypothetical protein
LRRVKCHEIVLVDDDRWRRRGVVATLEELGGILHVHDDIRHADMASGRGWGDADVVFVSADSSGDPWDRFGGLDAARAVRDAGGSSLRIVLLLPSDFGSVAMLRALESRVDEVCSWQSIQTHEDLERLVLVPDHRRHPRELLDLHALTDHGLSSSSRPNAALEYIAERELEPLFDFAPQLTRRRMIGLRSDLGDLLRITPVGASGEMLRSRSLPPWRQLQSVVNLARGRPTRS